MSTALLVPADPWRVEIIAVRGSHSGAERRALSRDAERGRILRLLPGTYVERLGFEGLAEEDQHIVRMRAAAAATSAPVVFSHWSAAVLHGLPVLRARLAVLHVVSEDPDARHRRGLAVHLFRVDDREVVRFHELLATGVGRTVVDVAGGAPFDEGVMAADGALTAGVPRALLESAVDLAGPRRASIRIDDAVAFGHPGGESAAESRWRTSSFRLGVEVPVLQHPVRLAAGSRAFLDGLLPGAGVGVEVDGDAKYLDPRIAKEGTGRALVREKRREDEVRLGLRGLVRPGWVQTGSPSALRALYDRLGVQPSRPRPTIADFAAEARSAEPRRLPRHPRWRA